VKLTCSKSWQSWRSRPPLGTCAILLLHLHCIGGPALQFASDGVLSLEIRTVPDRPFHCRVIRTESSSSFEVEDDMLFNPMQNPFHYSFNRARMKMEVVETRLREVPVNTYESLHILCEEDRYIRSQHHAVRLYIEPPGTEPRCNSIGSRFLSSKIQCSIPLSSSMNAERFHIVVDLRGPASQPEPVRSCASPFSGLEDFPIWMPEVHERMRPTVLFSGKELPFPE